MKSRIIIQKTYRNKVFIIREYSRKNQFVVVLVVVCTFKEIKIVIMWE